MKDYTGYIPKTINYNWYKHKKPTQDIFIMGDMACIIPFPSTHPILIDYLFLSRILGKRIHINNQGYAQISVNNHQMLLHRIIANTPKDMATDHINGDKLDNRSCNLRVCTYPQNRLNAGKHKNCKSGFKGVTFDSTCNRWRAHIKKNKKLFYLGSFKTPQEAHKAYCERGRELFGEYFHE